MCFLFYFFIYFLFLTGWKFPVNSLQAVPLLDQVIMGWENIVEEGHGQLEWGLFKRVYLSEYCAMIAQTFKVVVGCVCVSPRRGEGGGVGGGCFTRLRVERTLSEQ